MEKEVKKKGRDSRQRAKCQLTTVNETMWLQFLTLSLSGLPNPLFVHVVQCACECIHVCSCVCVCLAFQQPGLQMHRVVIVWHHIKWLKETFLWVSCQENGISFSPFSETITGQDMFFWLSWALRGLHEYVKISRKLLKQKKDSLHEPNWHDVFCRFFKVPHFSRKLLSVH